MPPINLCMGFARAYGPHVVERSERNPVVQGQEQHMETLEREQRACKGMHDGPEFTAFVDGPHPSGNRVKWS